MTLSLWRPAKFEEILRELRAFRLRHGHFLVPAWQPGTPGLARACRRIRSNLSLLSLVELQEFHRLGFDFGKANNGWIGRFAALARFRQRHGHLRVPIRCQDEPKLNSWLHGQRQWWSRMRADRKRLFLCLGVDGRRRSQEPWKKMFARLRRFHERYGHCRAPRSDLSLWRWTHTQRAQHRGGTLAPDRRRFLESLGFVFCLTDEKWNRRFEALKRFRARHGHCRVPTRYSPNRSLGIWVFTQRRRWNRMDPRRHRRLERIGFEWKIYNFRWSSRFAELRAFKKRFGHFHVPERWRGSRGLSRWISNQRKEKRMGKLAPERIRMLDDIGFSWNPAAG